MVMACWTHNLVSSRQASLKKILPQPCVPSAATLGIANWMIRLDESFPGSSMIVHLRNSAYLCRLLMTLQCMAGGPTILQAYFTTLFQSPQVDTSVNFAD